MRGLPPAPSWAPISRPLGLCPSALLSCRPPTFNHFFLNQTPRAFGGAHPRCRGQETQARAEQRHAPARPLRGWSTPPPKVCMASDPPASPRADPGRSREIPGDRRCWGGPGIPTGWFQGPVSPRLVFPFDQLVTGRCRQVGVSHCSGLDDHSPLRYRCHVSSPLKSATLA